MNKLKTQANKLWQLIFDPSTAATYQQTLGTTWAILRETGLLIWLVVCLVLVLGDWFWQASYATGQNTRTWVNNMQTSAQEPIADASSGDVLGKTGKSLLSAGRSSLAATLAAAKEQLGIDTEVPASKPIALISPSSEETAPTPTAIAVAPASSDQSSADIP